MRTLVASVLLLAVLNAPAFGQGLVVHANPADLTRGQNLQLSGSVSGASAAGSIQWWVEIPAPTGVQAGQWVRLVAGYVNATVSWASLSALSAWPPTFHTTPPVRLRLSVTDGAVTVSDESSMTVYAGSTAPFFTAPSSLAPGETLTLDASDAFLDFPPETGWNADHTSYMEIHLHQYRWNVRTSPPPEFPVNRTYYGFIDAQFDTTWESTVPVLSLGPTEYLPSLPSPGKYYICLQLLWRGESTYMSGGVEHQPHYVWTGTDGCTICRWIYVLDHPNTAPTLNPIGNKEVTERQPLWITLGGSDPDGDWLTFSASNVPTGAVFNPGAWTFSWTPTYEQSGNYSVLFTVTDHGTPPASTSETVVITVGNTNRLPQLDAIASPQAVAEGGQLHFKVTAHDPDGADTLTLAAANLPSGASFDPVTGEFDWSPGYSQAGAYQDIRFTVSDGQSGSASQSITIVVGDVNRPPVLDRIGTKVVAEGETLRFTVTGTDPDGDPAVFSAGNLPEGASFDSASHEFVWTPAYSDAGNYTDLEFSVSDDGGEVAVELVTITVGNVNRVPQFAPVGTQRVEAGETLTLSVTASDPDGDDLTYSSSTLPDGAVYDGTSGLFRWTPTANQAGSATITFLATDSGSPSETAKLDVLVMVSGGLTPAERANALLARVNALGLPKAEVNSYAANLKKVGRFVEAGQVTPAVNQLRAFVAKVAMDVSRETISAVTGDDLTTLAAELIAILEGEAR